MAQISDSLDLCVHFLVALFCNLVIDHVPFGMCVFNPSELLQLPSCSHIQIGPVKVVLADFVVVVEDCKLVVLLRLQAELHVGVLQSAPAICTSFRASLAVIALLDVFRKVSSHILHELAGDLLFLTLRGDELLIESILFFSDCVDAVEVVHVTDGAGASS